MTPRAQKATMWESRQLGDWGWSGAYRYTIRARLAFGRNSTGAGQETWAWCQALDPDSYGLTDDMDSFGILWCRQEGCQNYYLSQEQRERCF